MMNFSIRKEEHETERVFSAGIQKNLGEGESVKMEGTEEVVLYCNN